VHSAQAKGHPTDSSTASVQLGDLNHGRRPTSVTSAVGIAYGGQEKIRDRSNRSHKKGAGIFSRVANAATAWNDARVTRNVLFGLSDRLLDDVGLTRAGIKKVGARNPSTEWWWWRR